jgi:hypothetical protein
MAQGREFQAHQVIKHLTVVSKLGGFNVNLTNRGGKQAKYNYFVFSRARKLSDPKIRNTLVRIYSLLFSKRSKQKYKLSFYRLSYKN